MIYFPNCKPIQIIFSRNIAEKNCIRLTSGNFDIYSLYVDILHCKVITSFLSIP